MTACKWCGRKYGHKRGCTRPHGASIKLPNGKPVTVESCRFYFDQLGWSALTEVQRIMFRFLLEHAENPNGDSP